MAVRVSSVSFVSFVGAVAAITAAAAAQACSLIIPFGDYPGPEPSLEAGPPDVLAPEEDVIDEDGRAAKCKGIDIKIDPLNCGACGRVCANGGACANYRCPVEVVLASDASAGTIRSMTVAPVRDAGTTLYFTSTANGTVGRIILNDLRLEIAPTGSANAAVGEVTVNTPGNAASYAGDAAIYALVDPENTFTTKPPPLVIGRPGLGPIWLEGSDLYFGDQKGLYWTRNRADAAIDGAGDASPPPVAFTTLTKGNVVTLYWTSAQGTVMSMAAQSPTPNPNLVVNAELTDVTSIAVTTKFLYLTRRSHGLVIFDISTTPPTPRPLIAMVNPEVVIASNTHIFVVDFGSAVGNKFSRLYRMSLDGTEMILLADGFTGARGLAVAGEFVYFGDGPSLMRTTK